MERSLIEEKEYLVKKGLILEKLSRVEVSLSFSLGKRVVESNFFFVGLFFEVFILLVFFLLFVLGLEEGMIFFFYFYFFVGIFWDS